MSVRFLLDTNVVSNLLRHPHGRVTDKIAAVGEDRVAISIFVATELRFGCARKGSARLTAEVDNVLAAFEILAFEAPADRVYADIRVALAAAGKPIGAIDMLIAAHALALDLTLVTANTREFRRVPGLSVENWLTDD